ncbi:MULTISPECIES: hypothetical protein [Myroides]|uniref:Uncharacterized protein n=1 Tax=Myroides albus TaxID=2562892 RepID=A0A6I3LDD0_9FLAO|nr:MULTISPECIES: hypothetical protein [Myroides]MTG97499.1 hypothetical protein [Myroides albus]MVX35453.1 hypothetical protein [Myroides sp. LoEW2-1]UVD81224.1 hypothetical protein NWE55_08305 [Myroides albus]
MLNKGTKSEEDRRIESIVQKLSSIGFVPEDKKLIGDLDEELKKVGLSYESMLVMANGELAPHLLRFHFSWEYMEQFGDVLVKWSSQEPLLKAKAKAVYQFIQDESKAFSFAIMTKISSL